MTQANAHTAVLVYPLCSQSPLDDLIPFIQMLSLSLSLSRSLSLSLSVGNAAVVKPSELSECSSLLLRALLPRYLDQVGTCTAAIVDTTFQDM